MIQVDNPDPEARERTVAIVNCSFVNCQLLEKSCIQKNFVAPGTATGYKPFASGFKGISASHEYLPG